ncbi:glutathione S-transferase-like protein ustS [Penicillium bovifimosum]|uniref:Glutathione S-transferase-like protein ustS n=1 Tax=Penicillium bovifimosum TaxID=126998 RepID=A0A9W9GTA1_9EURO|nr:glutathione S-transferase-like protein ustS [Penicillium bovifimosum]KAJ5129689.1 glutathione S-transferase-like protein ustS [Penicillium bovifimosum]
MSTPITFYDIATKPPVEKTCCSPNPWKTRLALNFKNLPYTTKWVPLPDITKVRTSLNMPACRKFADGTDFYTLPIIEDTATNSTIGDSFDIAAYLQRTYPDSGADLFPAQKLDYVFNCGPAAIPLTECRESEYPEYAKFNVNVDAAFTAHVLLAIGRFPFDPATAEVSKAEFVRRAGLSRWEDFNVTGEAREKVKESFREALGGLAKIFKDGGPFVLGNRASYADLIIGGWLRMFHSTMPEGEWEEVRAWHGGLFGRLYDALEVYAKV